MDQLHALSVFVAVADSGSFAGAARALRLSPPAVTRAVAGLEERLGARLFTRTTRVVRVTEAGARFLEDCRRILADLGEAEEAASGSHSAPRGQLTVTAPVLFGQLYLTPLLTGFLERYPQVTVRALFLDRIVSLIDEGIDVAVRIGELPDSSLTATRVGEVRRVIVGTPQYFERNARPRHPDDLAAHRIVAASPISPAVEWRFGSAEAPTTVRVTPPLTVNTNDAAINAALTGWGLTRVLSYQVAKALGDGRLECVLDEFQGGPLPIHVVHQEGRRAPAKVRAFVDFIVTALRGDATIQGR